MSWIRVVLLPESLAGRCSFGARRTWSLPHGRSDRAMVAQSPLTGKRRPTLTGVHLSEKSNQMVAAPKRKATGTSALPSSGDFHVHPAFMGVRLITRGSIRAVCSRCSAGPGWLPLTWPRPDPVRTRHCSAPAPAAGPRAPDSDSASRPRWGNAEPDRSGAPSRLPPPH